MGGGPGPQQLRTDAHRVGHVPRLGAFDAPTIHRGTGRPTSGSRGRSATRSTRLKHHLITRGEWSEEQHSELVADIDREVFAAAKEAEAYGTLLDGRAASARSIFEDVFKDMPEHLQRQRRQMEEEQ